jgi:hypothetical protein
VSVTGPPAGKAVSTGAVVVTGAESIGCAPVFMPPRIEVRPTREPPYCASIAAARRGAEAELAARSTGGALRFSFGLSELLRTRTASPSRTNATTNP